MQNHQPLNSDAGRYCGYCGNNTGSSLQLVPIPAAEPKWSNSKQMIAHNVSCYGDMRAAHSQDYKYLCLKSYIHTIHTWWILNLDA